VPAFDPRKDAYAVLGAHPDSTTEEIEAAYRQAARTWHPDKSPAPDAADRFREVCEAAEILREPATRRDYDLERRRFYGAPPKSQQQRKRPREPVAYAPIPAKPAWLEREVRIVRDSVIFPVEPRRKQFLGELAAALSVTSLVAAIVTGDLLYAMLAILGYAIHRVHAQPPEQARIAWAKLTPGQKLAEYTALDQRAGMFTRYEVPYTQLHVGLTELRRGVRLELRGFPGGPLILHRRIKLHEEARKFGREFGRWLGVPFVAT